MIKKRMLAWALCVTMVITMIPDISFAGDKIELPKVASDSAVTLSGALYEKCTSASGEINPGDDVIVVDCNTMSAVRNNAGADTEPAAVDVGKYLSTDKKNAYIGGYVERCILWSVEDTSGGIKLKNTSGKYFQGVSVLGTTYSTRVGDNSESDYSKKWIYDPELCSMYCNINNENRYLYTDGNTFSMTKLNQNSIGIYKKTTNKTSVDVLGTTVANYDGNIKLPTVDSRDISDGFSIKYSMSGNDGTWASKESADEVNGFPINVGSYVVYVGLFNSNILMDVAAVNVNIKKAADKVEIIPRDASVGYNEDYTLRADVAGLENTSNLSYKFAVYDSKNKMVKKGVSVNTKGLPAGKYVIKIEAEANEYANKNYDIDTSATAELIVNNTTAPITNNTYKITFNNTDGLYFVYSNGVGGIGYANEGSQYTFKAIVGEGYGTPAVYDGTTQIQGTKMIADGNTVYTYNISNVTSDHTITASVKKLLTLNYNLNGGNSSTSFSSAGTYNENNTVQISYVSPTKDGYVFSGWYSSADGILYKAGSSFVIKKDTYLTAQWEPLTYSIKYNRNGATLGNVPVDEIKYEKGAKVEVLGNNGNLIKNYNSTGYRFIGWTKDAAGNGTLYKAGDRLQIDGNINLYAQWEEGRTVTYYGNGALSGVEPKDNTCYADDDVAIVMGNTGGLTKGSFLFNGWNTNKDGKGYQYEPGDEISINGKNVILYAMWRNNYILTYNANGGSGIVPVDNKYYNLNETVTVQGNTGGLTNGIQKFVGWNTNPYGTGTLYIPGATFKMAYDTVLYAQWGETLKVKYNANGGEGTVPTDDKKYEAGETVTVKGKTASLKKDNCTFNGWFIDTNGDGICESGEPCYAENETFLISGNVELKANWNGTLQVTYSAKDASVGDVPVDNKGYAENDIVTVLGNIGGLKKGDMVLAGWTTDPYGAGTLYKAGDKLQINKNTTLYAKWSEVYEVNYYGGSATGDVPKDNNKYSKDDIVTVLGNEGGLVNGSAVFGGWNTRWDGKGTTYVEGSQFKIQGNVDLYPVWGITYKVTYEKNKGIGSVPVDSTSYSEKDTVDVMDNIGRLYRFGYVFNGWFVDSNDDNEYQSDEDWYCAGAQFEIDKNVTLKARWDKTYSITYEENGADSGDVPVDAKIYTEGKYANVMGNKNGLARKGYVFKGWFADDNNNGIYDNNEKNYQEDSQIKITGDVTLKADWGKIFKVSYNNNSDEAVGNVPSDKKEYTEGETVKVLGNTGNLTRQNYIFNGWFIDKNDNNRYDEGSEELYLAGSEFTIESDVVLKANWGKTYTLKYLKNGADSGALPAETEFYALGTKATVKQNTNNLQRTNYTFAGWFVDQNGNGKWDNGESKYYGGEELTIQGNIALTANWQDTYTVQYCGNTQTEGLPPTDYQRYEAGDMATVMDAGDGLRKTGYVFDGWTVSKDSPCGADATDTVYRAGDKIKISGNVLLKARWTKAYTVTYNGNGATEGNVPKDNNQYVADSTVTIKGNSGDLINGNKSFAGWCVNMNGDGIIYKPGNEIQITDDIVLYAQWSELYSVTYDANGASCNVPLDPTSYTMDDVVIVRGNVNALYYSGKKFNGWFIDTNDNDRYDFGEAKYLIGESFNISGNVTLKANWSNMYSVTYEANCDDYSGTVPDDPNEYIEGSTANISENTGNLARPNYVLNGWFIDKNSNNRYDQYTEELYLAGNKLTILEDVTLKANWGKAYTVSYLDNGADSGLVPTDRGEYPLGSEATVKGNTSNLQKTDYVFAGWFVDSNGNGKCDVGETKYVEGDKFTILGNVVLTANWEDTYTVEYCGNEQTSGSAPKDYMRYKAGDTAIVKAAGDDLKKSGFIFSGWIITSDSGCGTDVCAVVYKAGDQIKINGNIKLKAKWSKAYSITYNGNGATGGAVPKDTNEYAADSIAIIMGNTGGLVNGNRSFAGWCVDKNGNDYIYKPKSEIQVSSDILLYAQWSDVYTVTYDVNGACCNVPVDPSKYTKNDTVVVKGNVNTLCNNNKIFNGWFIDSNNNGKWDCCETRYLVGQNFNITENVTLKACWSDAYTVTYDSNDADSGYVPADNKKYGYNDEVTVLGNTSNLKKNNYVFNGWYIDVNNNDRYDSNKDISYSVGAKFNITSDVVLKANWSDVYRVTYESNNAQVGTVPYDASEYAENEVVTVMDNIGNLQKDGYIFNGWYIDTNNSHTCDYDEINYAPGATFRITGNVTLRADWDKTYRVVYNKNGANGGTVPVDGKKYNLNDVATVYGNTGNLTRDNGLIFDCWNTKYDGSGTDYCDNSTVKVTKNITLYAQWKTGDYTVAYHDEYGNPIKLYNDGMKYKANSPFTIDYDYEPKNSDDYIFVGWKNSYDGNIYWQGETFNIPGADVVLTAVVKENDKFSLSFDANSAKGIEPETIYEAAGTVVVIPDNDGLRYDGYRFTGWNTRADGKGSNYEPGNKIVMPEKNLILYAQWAKEYTVRFVLGNGSGKNGNPTQIKEQVVILGDYVAPVATLNKYTENNGAGGTSIDYYFSGWKNQNGNYWSFEHDTVNSSCFDGNGIMTLYAQWDENKHYNFIFDDNLAKGKDAYVTINGRRTYDANGNFIGRYEIYNKGYNDYLYSREIPEFERIDYKFTGWYFDSTCIDKFNPANKLSYYTNLDGYADPRDNTVILYAGWSPEYDTIGSVNIDSGSIIGYGHYGEYYSDWISARSVDGNSMVCKNFYISSGSLPTGLALNSSTGEIYGVPVEEGEFTFTVIMTNDEGIPISRPATFTITIQSSVLYIDHNGREYSKSYGTADPAGLLDNNSNLTVTVGGSGNNNNVSGISISGSDNTVTVKYDYSNNIYRYSPYTNSFKKATTKDELINYMRYAVDLNSSSTVESRKDIFRLSFKRQAGEDAGQYKLYMENSDVKLIKKNGMTVNASGNDISGYSVEIAGGFQSKSVSGAASKYIFTINPADLVINSANGSLTKTYGEDDPAYTINGFSIGASNARKIEMSDTNNLIYISYNGGGNANFTDTLEAKMSRVSGEDVGDYQLYISDKNLTGRGTTKITTPIYDKANPINNYNLIVSDTLTNNSSINSNYLTIKKRSIAFVADKNFVYGELKPGSIVEGHFSDGSLARNDNIRVSDSGSVAVNSTAPLSNAGYLKVSAVNSDPDVVLKVAATNNKYISGANNNTTKSADTSGNYSVLSMDNFVISPKATTVVANTVTVTKGAVVSASDILNLTKCTNVLSGDKVNANVISYKINNVEYKSALEAAEAVGTFTDITSVDITYSGLTGADSENYSIPDGTFTITSNLSQYTDQNGDSGGGGSSSGGGGGSVKSYSITCTVGVGGYLLPSPNNKGKIDVKKGDDQKIEIICERGYTVDTVKVDGKKVGDDASYTFENIKKSHTFAVTFKKTGFSFKNGHEYCLRDNSCPIFSYKDSDTMAWYHDGVHFCLENGIMNGMSYTDFAPNGTTTRAMLVTILYRIEGSPVMTGAIGFTDVDTRGWYYDAVRWANRNGIVEGYNTKTFGPNDAITREQLAVILARYAEYKGVNISKKDSLKNFTDVDKISNWALGSIQWAVKAGLIKGKTETTIDPLANATRAEIATLIMRFCESFL